MDRSPAVHPAARQSAQLARAARRQRGWSLARQAATLLKVEYHATRVVAFGSLADPDRFHAWSDVDLAAWGLSTAGYFEAVARLLDLGGDIGLDLVLAERCKPALREAIEAGTEL